MSELDKLQKTNKEKNNLDFKDQQKIDNFLKKQKQEDEKLKEFAEKIKENLNKFKPEDKDAKKDLLKERLEKSAKELEKNQKLLDELKELNQKLEQDELSEKIEKFQQKSKNQTKTLEQLVELTKRYYLEKKAQQLQDKLDKLADKQDALSDDKKDNTEEKQEEINKEFDKIQKDLDELQKENQELKSPLEIPQDKETEKSIDDDLKKSSDALKKNQAEAAKPKQKSAAKKMKQMSSKMSESMSGGQKEELEEDIVMMRQILDNLLAFSFSQESLMKKFKTISNSSNVFSKHLKTQQDLKAQFKHVDDSLFAMSLRNPKIAENITNEIGKVYYNVDKSIKSFTDNNMASGTSSQQFTLTSANNLANMLADVLSNMQMSMSSMGSGSGKPKPGKGQGSGMQLPDIIKKQDGLADKMKEGQKKGKKPGEKPGEGKDGKSGKDGKQGKSGKDGKSGESGEGNGEKGGENGQDGEGDAKAVLDILKEQRQLRDALEKELEKNGLSNSGKNASDQMKQLEKQLINKGFSNDAIQKALNLKYELLKLEKAVQEQNQDTKRQSNTNKKDFNNSASPLPQKLQEYLNSIEILNRQTLPLRSNFSRKVQEYFKENDKF